MSAILILDTETSGLHCASCGIVEVGAVLIEGGRIVEAFEQLCWPGYSMLSEPHHWKALTISGINPALLLDAPPVEDALAAMAGWFGAKGPLATMSYNSKFDRSFIEAAAPWAGDYFRWDGCLMEKSRRFLGLPRSPSLATACERLGIERSGAHRALSDARSAAEIFLAMEGLR